MPAVHTDPLVLEIIARTDALERSVKSAQAKFTTETDRMVRASADMRKRIEANNGAISASFKSMVGGLAAGLSVREIASMADSYTRFTNQLKVAGLEGQNLAGVQDKLFQVAQRNGVELESVGTLYSRAAQNQKELGASTSDLIGLTRAVAASLRISGTSTNEASGALLQLGQALGSPRVQAEEFNSLLDTMQPLLREASKYIDGTGNSLSGLTRKIKDQKGPGVSNVELFRAITRAMADLEKTADGTALTIDGAFTKLSNAMTKYIGEADKANGASAAVTAGLATLAENLDTVTDAVALLAAVMLGRYVAGMAAGATASGAAGAAIFALQARAAGAATSMEALAFTGRAAGASMLAAFGGPVGAAVTALTVAVGYYVVKQQEAAAAAAALQSSVEGQSAQFAVLQKNQAATAAATNNLTSEQRAALTATANLTGEANKLSEAWARVAAQAKAAAIEQARTALFTARHNVQDARTAYQQKRDSAFAQAPRPFAERGLGQNLLPTDPSKALVEAEKASAAERKLYEQASANVRTARQEYDRIVGTPLASAEFKPAAPAAAPGSTSKAKGRKPAKSTSAGRSTKDVEDQQTQDLARLNVEELNARLDLATDLQERAKLQAEILAEERKARVAEIEKNRDLSRAQKDAQIGRINKLYGSGEGSDGGITVSAGLYQRRAAREQQEQLDREALEVAQASARNQQDLLHAQADLTETREERRAVELRLLDIAYDQERAELEATVASATASQAAKDIAAARLRILDQLKGYDVESTSRQYESPLEQKRREVRDTAANMGDAIENIELSAIDRLTDGIANASTEFVKLGGIAGDVINGIIRDIIKLAAQQVLFGGSGSGGAGALVGPLRAPSSTMGAVVGTFRPWGVEA